jgi:hypothetical protein
MHMSSSVADPGCPESRTRIFPSRIQGQKDYRIRIRIKEFKNLSILTQKIVSNGMFISDPDLDFYPSRISDLGVKKAPGSATLISSVSIFTNFYLF